MERIKLSSFELEEYDSCNSDHQEYTKYFEKARRFLQLVSGQINSEEMKKYGKERDERRKNYKF